MLFYIRIELDRSNADGRSLQASTDKMLCFQGLYGFWRDYLPFLDFLKSIESTGQTDFSEFAGDSSQTVVTPSPLTALAVQGIIKQRMEASICVPEIRQKKFCAASIMRAVRFSG